MGDVENAHFELCLSKSLQRMNYVSARYPTIDTAVF